MDQHASTTQGPLSRSAELTIELLNRANITGSEKHDFSKIPAHVLKKLRKHARAKQRQASCALAVSSK